MSEPTPLSAEAARAMTLLVMASRVDPNLRSAVADVESYIAELQREIEGYRQALAKAAKVLSSSDGCGNGPYGPICFRLTGDLCTSCAVLVATGVKVIASEECAQALAGKEAQGD